MADNKIRTGELFAGIGGIGLGLEATGGFEVVWQVENDPYATRVLEKNWPDARRWDDVKTFPPEGESWDVDLITAGFPCTDISNNGQRKGLQGEKSRLFYEIIRIAGIIKPRWLLLENVSAVLIRGIGAVLGEVATISGRDDTPHFRRMEYHCLPAASLGAPHRRDRFFLLADSEGERIQECRTSGEQVAEAHVRKEILMRCSAGAGRDQWAIEPELDRVAHGVRNRTHRIRCLGNAVVPQVAEFFGQLILDRIEHHD